MAKKRKSARRTKAEQVAKIGSRWKRDPVTHRVYFVPPSKADPTKQ